MLMDPINLSDLDGLTTKRCARGLGGKNEPAMSPSGNPLRHEYLVVGNDVYSFQAGSNMLLSQGYIDNNENTSNNKCEIVSNDPAFDKAVVDAVNQVGAPIYNVGAYPGTTPWVLGARNCQTWADDVVDMAKEKTKKKSP